MPCCAFAANFQKENFLQYFGIAICYFPVEETAMSERDDVTSDNMLTGIEVYTLDNHHKPFAAHFHDHYTVGLMESGEWSFECAGKEYPIGKDSIVMINPGESHACRKTGEQCMRYLGINIPVYILDPMLCGRMVHRKCLPGFSERVVSDRQLAVQLRRLHDLFLHGKDRRLIWESTIDVLKFLFSRHAGEYGNHRSNANDGVELACRYMEKNYYRNISLDILCRMTHISRSAMIRNFIKAKNITPHAYLRSVRIHEAKKMLTLGWSSCDVALQTGFVDQSHFINQFRQISGFTPGQYRKLSLQGKEARNAE